MNKDNDEKVQKTMASSLIRKLPETLVHFCGPSASPTQNTTLIPRHVFTHNIQVFPVHVDTAMDFHRSQRPRGGQPPRSGAQNALGRSTPLHAAIKEHNLELAKMTLIQQPDLFKTYDEEGRTPLSCAAYYGFEDIVVYMLGSFPNSKDIRDKDDSSWAIHKACLRGHLNVLTAFHSNDPKSLLKTDRYGRNILHIAVKGGDRLRHVFSYLVGLERIGDRLRRMTDENGRTPF